MPIKDRAALCARLGLPSSASEAEITAAMDAKLPEAPPLPRTAAAAPIVPTKIAAFARRHGVDVSQVTCGDTVMSYWDIAQDATARGDEDAAIAAIRANTEELRAYLDSPRRTRSPWPASRTGTVTSDDLRRVPVDAMSRNPLVDQVRTAAHASRRPSPSGGAPTLFASGDTPAFTASGIPPTAVLGVPWQARHAMASATTAAEAYAIQAQCAEDTDMAALFANHPGNADYAYRVDKWRAASLTDDELMCDGSPAARDEAQRRNDEVLAEDLSAEDEAVLGEFLRHVGINPSANGA